MSLKHGLAIATLSVCIHLFDDLANNRNTFFLGTFIACNAHTKALVSVAIPAHWVVRSKPRVKMFAWHDQRLPSLRQL